MPTRIARRVLECYPEIEATATLVPLGNAGGLSGSTLWRVTQVRTPRVVCLRCWPADYPARDRLPLMHHVLQTAAARGCTFLPHPLHSRRGETFVATDERGEIVPVSDEPSTSRGCRFWEATRWLPGQAMLVEESASWELLQYAVAALGKFHRLTADLHPRRGPIPGLLDRRHRLQQWQGGLCDEIERAIRQASAHPGNSVACAIFERIARYADGVERELAEAAVAEYSLQPCIRDVRPEHFLFVDQEVRGLVDFGALRIDHVAGDLARLLGSLWPRWQHDWRRAIDVYADEFRALGEEELQIMQLFDRSTTLVASINWLDWVFGQQRQFESLQQVTHRLQRWLERLQSWSSR